MPAIWEQEKMEGKVRRRAPHRGDVYTGVEEKEKRLGEECGPIWRIAGGGGWRVTATRKPNAA